MARFQVLSESDRAKKRSMLGNKHAISHIRTWGKGVLVEANYDSNSHTLVFSVWETGGSRHPTPMRLLARIEG